MKISTPQKASILGLFIACILHINLIGQEVKMLSMEECIDMALTNNIDLKRAKNNSLIAAANKKQAILNFLPTLQGRINYDFYTGTFFDSNVGTQVQETTNSSGPNINSNLVVFNGFRNHHTKKQSENLLQASNFEVESVKQTVATNVINFYLSVAAGKENIKISEERLDLLNKQLEREDKRVDAGVGNLEEVYNLKSQVATERLNLITLKNTYERNKLLLIQTLQLENNIDLEIAPINIDDNQIERPVESYGEIMSQVVSFSPGLKQANYNLTAAKNGIDISKSALFPTLSFFGQIGSNYSSNGGLNPETGDIDRNATFRDQLGFNQYEYFNISLNIPLFNRGITRNNIQVAKINMVNAELDYKQAEVTLTNAVQQAYLDLVAAKSTYEAANEILVALEQSFKFMEARYNSGNSDFYTYLESLNNKNRGEIDLINAKYSIALRRKILNVYQGLE